jgi:GNAT superfamily N-acetyltransferase
MPPLLTNLTVRFIEQRDRAQWQPMWDGYNRFYGRPAFPAEITDITWSRFFDPTEPVHALVAEQDGKLLGMTHYLFHRSTTLIDHSCYLQDLFTIETARGKGVARALIEAVHDQAKIAKSGRVYWQTHETNIIAMKFYDKVAERTGFLVYRLPM